MEGMTHHRKRVRSDSPEFEFEFDSDPTPTLKARRIRDDLLSLLDDSDTVPDRDSTSQDLDSVIRSFEAEISGSGSGTGLPPAEPPSVVDLTSDSGDSQPDLGQFLGYDTRPIDESSSLLDDGNEFFRVSAESGSGVGEFWEFQDELRSINSIGFGSGSYEENTGNGDNHGYVALDGIFDYPDVNLGSDLWWPPETLPAL